MSLIAFMVIVGGLTFGLAVWLDALSRPLLVGCLQTIITALVGGGIMANLVDGSYRVEENFIAGATFSLLTAGVFNFLAAKIGAALPVAPSASLTNYAADSFRGSRPRS